MNKHCHHTNKNLPELKAYKRRISPYTHAQSKPCGSKALANISKIFLCLPTVKLQSVTSLLLSFQFTLLASLALVFQGIDCALLILWTSLYASVFTSTLISYLTLLCCHWQLLAETCQFVVSCPDPTQLT